MSAAFYVCFLLWCFQINAAGAQLPPPHNLNVISMNTNYTLIWDWDQGSAESCAVNFTTHYVAKFMLRSKKKSPNWNTGCETTSHRSCDLTNKNLFYLGIYVFRVRASVNGTDSDWATMDFCPDEEAALGPPSKVALSPEGRNLDIVISDPLSSTNRSMREHHEDLYFHIRYWERSADGQVRSSPHTPPTNSWPNQTIFICNTKIIRIQKSSNFNLLLLM
ncbi:interleukin-10 receptor subunit beta-like [Notothenia coriiceps]|uniref:Interleukin-10 receptor subunit beta-like n=1 Tax=Notothenia coriiceps TaxID=8208 RepID=A0A6I9PUH6_9TELE|nr:PREDICTED: interleukin-10 receptor subunit beta-like [Notothenia coriiceps]